MPLRLSWTANCFCDYWQRKNFGSGINSNGIPTWVHYGRDCTLSFALSASREAEKIAAGPLQLHVQLSSRALGVGTAYAAAKS
jgi:hypothetical protein